MRTKLFTVAIAIAIGIGFMPAGLQLFEFFSQQKAAKLELTPLVTEDELQGEIEKSLSLFQNAKTPDGFYEGVAQQKRVENLIDKYESVNGFLSINGMISDVIKRRINGAMTYTSQTLRDQHGVYEMAAVRENHRVVLETLESRAVTTTHTGEFFLYGFGWSAFVMFLVFAFRAQSLTHLVYEFVSGRLLLASVVWPFFAAEYMKKQSTEYQSVTAMAKFAAVNLSILLSAFITVGMAQAQTGKKSSKGKRATAVIVDESIAADGAKNPETTFVVSTKKDGILLESAAILNKNGATQFGTVGKEVVKNSAVTMDAYSGWRGDFKYSAPDAHRIFGGLRLSLAKKLNKDNTLAISVPFAHYEQYIKPKLKSAFFSTGQVFDRFKSKFRFGGEYVFRKEHGGKPIVSGGPFAGVNIFSKVRLEGLLLFSNSGPPRARLRTVFVF